jgi:hypothetical protein
LVPKQASQDQEVERFKEPAGPTTNGSGTVQSHYRAHVRR